MFLLAVIRRVGIRSARGEVLSYLDQTEFFVSVRVMLLTQNTSVGICVRVPQVALEERLYNVYQVVR